MSLSKEELRKMNLEKEELRKSVETELCEALKYAGRAANLLRHVDKNYYTGDKARDALGTADALARIVASTTEYIDYLLSR